MTDSSRLDYDRLRRRLYQEALPAEVFSPDEYRTKSKQDDVPISQLRRRRDGHIDDARISVTLTETDGVLRWEPGYGFAAPGRRRAMRVGPVVTGRVVAPVNFERLKPNQVGSFLESFDVKLTPMCDLRHPENGLRQLKNGVWSTTPVRPVNAGRILLFIHGTFSNIQNYVDELTTTPEGKDLLALLEATYAQVLGFDHATVAISPVLNALDLARVFQDTTADIDVIAHSRGGLVTRWWLEALDARAKRGKSRVILVGSPLDGTSLAAPDRLKSALDFFTNIAHAVELTSDIASGGFPFLTIVSGLLRVMSSITSFAVNGPVLDAAFACIPGLCAQSQISNNNELRRLNQASSRRVDYFGVRSSFQTSRPGWKFWRYFVNIGDRAKEAGATLVFQDENDLVVNTGSMAVLARTPDALIPDDNILDFGITDTIHHTVYFRQTETVKFIKASFQLG